MGMFRKHLEPLAFFLFKSGSLFKDGVCKNAMIRRVTFHQRIDLSKCTSVTITSVAVSLFLEAGRNMYCIGLGGGRVGWMLDGGGGGDRVV